MRGAGRLTLLGLMLAASSSAAEEPSRETRCVESFEAARKQLIKKWSGFRAIDVSPPGREISAGLDLPGRTVYLAMFTFGYTVEDSPGAWMQDQTSAKRQFASGWGIISFGAANPFAVPKAALSRLGIFIAAFRKAIDECAS